MNSLYKRCPVGYFFYFEKISKLFKAIERFSEKKFFHRGKKVAVEKVSFKG